MKLEGSCHCGKVRFALECAHPYPFNLCYCSICRKTAGGGGFAINLGGDAASLTVEGTEHVAVYQAELPDGAGPSPAERRFCRHCASALWVWDPRWPELVHPVRFGRRYRPAGTAGARTPDAGFESALGRAGGRRIGPLLRRVPGGIHRRVAPATRAGMLTAGAPRERR